MNTLPAISQQTLSTFRRLSLEEIEALFFSLQEYNGFLIISFEHNHEWLEKLELLHVATGCKYTLNGPHKWTMPEPENTVEGSIDERV